MTPPAPCGMDGDIVPILLELSPADIALVKFVFESYEGIAVIRTLDRRRARIIALVSHDFLDVADAIIAGLEARIGLARVPIPGPIESADLLRDELDHPWAGAGDGD